MSGSLTLVSGLIACCFFLLAALARTLLREAWHPAALFAVNWGLVLLAVIAAAPLGFYAVRPESSLVFLGGAILFVIGSVCGDRLALATARPQANNSWDQINYKQLAVFCLFVHATLLPLWWQEMVRISGESSDLLVIGFQVRWKSVTGGETIGPLIGNYLVLGFIMVPILAVGAFRGDLPAWLALAVSVPWVTANLIANGRSSLVQLILAIIYLRATAPKPINLRAILAALGLFVAVFAGGVLLVAKGNTSVEDGAEALALGVLSNLSDYALQAPILFSRYFNGETGVASTWDALGFPCAVLQLAGLCVPGDQHQEFSEFGRFDQFGNVYTLYFSILPKYGPVGLVSIVLFYGAWTAWHHRRHQQRHSIVHSLLASYLFAAVILSTFADFFAPNLNFLLKTAIAAFLIQRVFRFNLTRPANAGELVPDRRA